MRKERKEEEKKIKRKKNPPRKTNPKSNPLEHQNSMPSLLGHHGNIHTGMKETNMKTKKLVERKRE